MSMNRFCKSKPTKPNTNTVSVYPEPAIQYSVSETHIQRFETSRPPLITICQANSNTGSFDDNVITIPADHWKKIASDIENRLRKLGY